MINTINLSFCTLRVYNNIVIAQMNEGIALTYDLIDEMVETVVPSFKGEPFVYITHRVHSYSVDPTIYIDVSQIENLVGFAVVSSNHMSLESTNVEKIFLKKPFEVFSNMEDSLHWANQILKNSLSIVEY